MANDKQDDGTHSRLTDGEFREMKRLARNVNVDIEKYRELWKTSLVFHIDVGQFIGFVGLVQLGLRHPAAANLGTSKEVRAWLEQAIEQIDPTHGDLYKFLMMGFDPTFDQ